MSDAPTAPDAMEVHRFPCEACGSDLRFAPGTEKLICDHCGNEEPIADATPWGGAIAELDFANAIAARLPEAEFEETRVLSCPNCGAQTEFREEVHAKECPFCATPVVTGTGTHRHIKPKGLLPFALTESEARDAMIDWLGGLWFAPNGLQAYARKGRRMNGVYIPFWTFDADTRSRYEGERGTVYYETRRVRQGDETRTVRVQKVRWRRVSGRVARFFDDVLVLASRSLPKAFTDGLEPWDLSSMEPYSPEYIAGFRAEGYVVELEDGFHIAREHMDRVILRDVRFDIGGDRQRVHGVRTEVSDVTFKHVLLPIWMAAYRYRNQSYRFVVNGRTGRVYGERPWSVWKISLAVAAGLMVAGVLGYLYAVYGEGAR